MPTSAGGEDRTYHHPPLTGTSAQGRSSCRWTTTLKVGVFATALPPNSAPSRCDAPPAAATVDAAVDTPASLNYFAIVFAAA